MNQERVRKRGWPKKPFDELSLITKRQNAKKIREELSNEELGFYLEKSLKSAGFLDASRVIKSIIERPAIGTDYVESYEYWKNHQSYTPDEALALSMDMKLSKRQYDIMYFGAKKKNFDLYPPYHHVLDAKKRCYPSENVTHISEIGFKIDLQAVLDITAKRLVETFPTQFAVSTQKLRLITKWGFDGASGQSQYKQKFQDPNADDGSIFITTLVPIVLRDMDKPEIVHWQNLKTSSTTLCRPIRLAFKKESEEYTVEIEKEILQEIANLQPTVIENVSVSIEIIHELICTMIDGKICNHLTATKSSQTCYICGANPTQMNDLDLVYLRPKNTEFYKYGLSTLHAWIRFMECVLHISYNMSFQKTSARTQDHKDAQELRKSEIQKEFKDKTGLKVHYVLQGKGTTNDGNTARRFFRDCKLTAIITGFDVRLLKKFAVILQTLASGRKINVEKFTSYTAETARLYVELYPWYYMPATVHKILIHGADVIDFAIVPVGQLSEEVQESRHKEVRRYREYNTRKVSRIKTNEDLLHSLLISSDPLITSYRQIQPSKKFELSNEVNNLLVDSNFESSSSSSESDED